VADVKTLQCTVVAPQGKVLDCHATSAVIPSHDGQLGILPGHMPIFCQLGLGPMEVDCLGHDGKSLSKVFLVIDGGFAMCNSNNLSVTAAAAVNISTITPEKFELLVEKCKADLAAAPPQRKLHEERRLSLVQSLRQRIPA
jgi:F-type H+-transporting ATPase subunit epsilon